MAVAALLRTRMLYQEFSSIMISRMAYVVMRPHRFVFNLGYGIDSSGMTSMGLLLTSMFIELCFEFAVDTIALQNESSNGKISGHTVLGFLV